MSNREIDSSTPSVVVKDSILGKIKDTTGFRMQLLRDAELMRSAQKTQLTLYLLVQHDYLTTDEGRVLVGSSLGACINSLRDAGYDIKTLRQRERRQYVLMSRIPNKAIKSLRAHEKKERKAQLEDDKGTGYRTHNTPEIDMHSLAAKVENGLERPEFYVHPEICRYPMSVREQLWSLYGSRNK